MSARRLAPLAALCAIGCIASPDPDPGVAFATLASSPLRDEYVITPNGYFHRSCVVELAPGEKMTDAPIEGCAYPRFDRDGRAVAAEKRTAPPPRVDGWVASQWSKSAAPIGTIRADWTVPDAPASAGDQVIYFFPGLEPAATGDTILQPVLGWYGGGWTIASWNCCRDGVTWHSAQIAVAPGDTITGTVDGRNCDGRGVCADWRIVTASPRGATTLDTTAFGEVLDWAFAAAFEGYGVDDCAQYPASGGVALRNVATRSTSGGAVSPAWSSFVADVSPRCDVGTGVSGATASVGWWPARVAKPAPPARCGRLDPGQGLVAGQRVSSCDGRFALVMQTDGNLVLYQGRTPLWASNTWGTPGFVAVMQGDGNPVVYDRTARPQWAAGTWGHAGAWLAVQDDGNLVVYEGNRPLWASNTCCR